MGFICAPGSTVALRELTIWASLWTTAGYPEPIESTKDSSTCCGLSEEWIERQPPKAAAATLFEFGAASLLVTCSPLLFIEANAISSLSGRQSSFVRLSEAGWQVSQHVCTHTFRIILSSQPTWREKAKSHQIIFHGEGHAWLKVKFYFFQNSDKFFIGSPIESSNVLFVDMLDCFAEYVIYINNWNISIEIFVRAIQSFCRLSTSPSVAGYL